MREDRKEIDSIGKDISKAYRLLSHRIMEEFSEYEIGSGQLYSLLALYEREGRCQNEICKMYNLNKAAVGRSLKKLENKNFIKRKTDPNDKRRKRVYLEKKGKSFRPECIQHLKNIENDIDDKLTSKEKKIFKRAIKKICQSLKCNSRENERKDNVNTAINQSGG